MPAKLSLNIRPIVIAGFAKLVELVKKYAAPMYAPTAAGANCARPERTREKISRTSPAVATISERKCGAVRRSVPLHDTAAAPNIRFAAAAPVMQPTTCTGM